jgi:hypothetical protein
MTRLASGDLVFPASQTAEAGVGGREKVLKLLLMAIFAGFTTNVLIVDTAGSRRNGRILRCRGDREVPKGTTGNKH